MQVFAIAVVVFIVIIYLIYMLSLPALEDRSDFQSIFYGLAVMQWITAAILLCSAFLYLKQIYGLNQEYGKVAAFEGLVFTVSNSLAGGFNFWLGQGEVDNLLSD